jgi:hypothetical protein
MFKFWHIAATVARLGWRGRITVGHLRWLLLGRNAKEWSRNSVN